MRLFSKLVPLRKSQTLALPIIGFTIVNLVLQFHTFYATLPGKESGKYRVTIQSKPNISTEQSQSKQSKNVTEQSQFETHRKSAIESDVKQIPNQTEAEESYKVVFFIGGQKCGSTTLATYLKHDSKNWTVRDPHGQFMESGKEVCWALSGQSKESFWKRFKTLGSKTATIALDACPQAIETKHLERMAKAFPDATYLMLVRDPVDRAISHMNAMIDRGKAKDTNIDNLLRKNMQRNSLPVRLSMFGEILKNAYSIIPKHKILIIPNPDLKRRPQDTVDKVLKHIGANPKNITLVEENKRKDMKTYQIPSNTTIKWLHDMFYRDWELFKNLSGLNIDTVYM